MDLIEERHDEHKNWDDVNDATLKVLVGDLLGTYQRIFLQAKTQVTD